MKKILIIYSIILITLDLCAQDPEFTQFYANPLYLNPAMVGKEGGTNFRLNFRDQWPGIPKSWVTFAASYDHLFEKKSFAIGIQVLKDFSGSSSFTRNNAHFAYSYILEINDNSRLNLALDIGIQQVSVDFSNVQLDDQIDPNLGFIYPTNEKIVLENPGLYKLKPFPDFSGGILYYSRSSYFGFAINHLNRPKQSLFDEQSILEQKFTIHCGTKIPITNLDNTYFSPNLVVQFQKPYSKLNFGAYLIIDKFQVGGWFRQTSSNLDACMFLLGYSSEKFKIGYSYDITFTQARFYSRGSHELSLTLMFNYPRDYGGLRKKDACPTF